MRETRRYTATNLRSVLREQERTVAWLARKCGVSVTLMHYIAHRQRTASHQVAQRAADVLNVPLFLLFDFTDENIDTASEMEAVA